MGRKKKVSASRTISTRSTRLSARGAGPSTAVSDGDRAATADSNSLDSENGSASQDASGENDSQDSNHVTGEPVNVSVPSLSHKKFGKFRCLLLNDTKYQLMGNSEVSGSDSETGSGVEVRIVDPCVSSESDCSTPIEFNNCASTSNSQPLKSFSKLSQDSANSEKPKTYLEKVLHSNLMDSINCSSDSNTLDSDTPINLNSMSFDTQIPDPTLNLIINSDPRRGFKVICQNPITVEENLSPATSETPSSGPAEPPAEDAQEDEEVITVYEIIEENGSDDQDLYYGLTTEDIIYGEPKNSPQIVEPSAVVPSDNNSSPAEKHVEEEEKSDLSTENCMVNDFQNRLKNLKLTSPLTECAVVLNPTTIENHISEPPQKLTLSRDIPSSTDSSEISPDAVVPKDSSTGESCAVILNHSEEESCALTKLDNMNYESNETNLGCSTDSSSCSSASGVRRSSRIKTISVLKQRSKGHGLVRAPVKKTQTPLVKEVLVKVSENFCDSSSKYSPDSALSSPSATVAAPLGSPSFPVPVLDSDQKPVKVKSRWRRSSEMEMGSRSPVTPPLHSPTANGAKLPIIAENQDTTPLKTDFLFTVQPKLQSDQNEDEDTQRRLKQFETILENEYHCDRTICKEARRMACDCFLTKEEMERGELGCGEDCLNRLLMIECNSRCPVGDRCTNRRFQTRQYSNLRVMRTEKKGLGIQAVASISSGDFLMEYVGEVLNSKHFNQRAEEYSSDKNRHHYFMALKGDAVIDATLKGNISRFINHSCDPNAETQKWTVNGELRIGFFSKRDIESGDEITFDYQFQRFGKEAQKCYCEASNCRGWIGEEPDTDSEEEDEESEDEQKSIEIKSEMDDGSMEMTDIKEEVKPEAVVDDSAKKAAAVEDTLKKRTRPKKYARAAKELLQDVDLEEEMELLGRSGVKNQSHTLSLCRAMVRAKRTPARSALLQLLASADLPCRRLFLDYRGLRLLAPWCQDADVNFRLQILTAIEKLPIPNKTILQECKLIAHIEKWLSETCPNKSPKEDSSDSSERGTPVLIDETTGLPVELPFKFSQKMDTDATPLNDSTENIDTKVEEVVVDHTEAQREEIARLCTLLLERWSQLKEIFKIPKKERIQLMKEHERQANEPQAKRERERDKEKEGGRRTRWEERYTRPDRDKKRSRPPSPEPPRRNSRTEERQWNSLSKEERRREFAERAAREEQRRGRAPLLPAPPPLPPNAQDPKRRAMPWIPPDFMQNPPPFPPMMMNGMQSMPPAEFMMGGFMPMEFMQQKPYMLPYCPPPQMFPVPMMDPGYMMLGQNTNFPVPPTLPPATNYQNIPLPPPPMNQHVPPPSVPEVANQMLINPPRPKTPLPQPIPTLVPNIPVPGGYPYPSEETLQSKPPFYPPPPEAANHAYMQEISPAALSRVEVVPSAATPTEENQDSGDVSSWAPVRLPSQWRSMQDPRGRTYYYHVKLRVPQWEPPLYSPTPHSRDEDSSDEDDASSVGEAENGDDPPREEFLSIKSKLVEGVDGVFQVLKEDVIGKNGIEIQVSPKKPKKRRPGLVTNCWIISPRREEDRLANQLELKKYKENKEKLRRRKEQALLATQNDEILQKYKKRFKDKQKKAKPPSPTSSRKKKEVDLDAEELEKRIKEIFRSRMARVMVHHLNPFRREDCPLGRIANNADFKHLARKLTHFVMLKELKHCKDVNELECNDSVKQKAKEFVKKYMAKFGPVYRRPPDEMD